MPIIAGSFAFAPIGAYLSTFIQRNAVLWMFAIFLIYAGTSALIPKKVNAKTCHDRHPKIVYLSVIGGIAGLVSGLLAVGGGGIISALMLLMGCRAKKVSMITALAVPFASLSGFVTYAIGGHISWSVLATVGVAALLGGYFGNKTAHSILPDKVIKYAIAILSIVFAFKIIFDLLSHSI